MHQEEVARVIAQHDILAVPVVDAERRVKGIVTVDDVVDVVETEATEDIQKIGGTVALDAPYLQTSIAEMMKKRAGWLAVLFVGELFTASAMGRYQSELEKALVLTLFIPLIISSGGNSGSQASTLDHPRHGARTGARARLVARRAPRARERVSAGRADPGSSASCASSPGSCVPRYGEHYVPWP
jgi:hypothetical protein